MIPNEQSAKALWDTYHLPSQKRIHCQLVSDVCLIFVHAYREKGIAVNEPLILASALLHDIDKAIEKLPGERHPDGAVRILLEHGMDEVAAVVRRHPLHAILDPAITPETREQKIVYLSDKGVKYAYIGLQERFRLWQEEEMTEDARATLDASYPKVKILEAELMGETGLTEKSIRLALESKK